MPKRKSPEGAEGKEASKVTKQEPTRRSERLSAVRRGDCDDISKVEFQEEREFLKATEAKFNYKTYLKPAPPKAEVKPKKTVVKKDEKGAKAKKGGAKGKKEDGPAQNGETKANEVSEAAEEATDEKA
ncbi:high mobility group nucleosome-binding domain-containing protein 3 isoform X2 [Poeciliopsis prolifica]|uniref:high mobility group nucleosome-binding domain-containing protein 3 isoform X2 n=1 Tax=Poeciliopsis prolifica TaxID=188132 RepID=UPI002412FF0C|nr:high mobility group nucleosome-binding domain-containing protein 3 isoform X2 [Poeciliopsis prolifica]